MLYAWNTLGFRVSLENCVREILDVVQTAQEEHTVCTALLQLSTLEHICSCWGDEENAVSIHQCIMGLHERSKYGVCDKRTNMVERHR